MIAGWILDAVIAVGLADYVPEPWLRWLIHRSAQDETEIIRL